MSQHDHDIQQVELSIEEAEKAIALGNDAAALADIPEFKRIVLDGYFVDEAARLALLSSDPGANDEIRANIMRDLNGPGAFKRYLHTKVMLGRNAERELESHHETLEELREEEEGV